MRNADVAAMLNRVADLLEIRGENFFKIRAYREAVRQLDNLTTEVEDMIKEGRLKDVPGIGEAIEKKIVEYVTTGQLDFLTRLEAEVPPALLELTRVPGLGPRTAKDIYDGLGILSLDALEDAARTHRLLAVRGIKAKTEENILKGIAMLKRTEGRIFFPEAWILADSLLITLRALPSVTRAEMAGSARRASETVGDLDLLVASDHPEAMGGEFARLPQVNEVIAQDGMTTSVRVRSGMKVDLRAVKPETFGAAWVTFTGSPAHVEQLGFRAERMDKVITGATEEEVYAAVGCAWIPPELREGRGEIELAASGQLPKLVQQKDLRGDLHTHSNWSDGRNEIAEMARAAKERGYAYIVLTDHTQSLQIAQGLTPERFRARAAEIATVNARSGLARVLNGAEVDILPDGSLDLPDDTLASLDLVVASVHVALDQPKDVITQRVLTALRSPHVDVFAHPTSRRLDRRGETSLDVEAVIAEAVKTGTALEINSSPFRLDLNDSWARKAREAGALLAIDNDAHYPAEYDYVRYGCAIGRRAGLTPDRVLNTRDAEGVLAHCREKQQEPSRISVEVDNAGIIKSRRRLERMLQELVIKVPNPFLGRAEVGFSTRYPAQPAQGPLKDVPFFIEGPSGPMRRLQSRLELFRQKRSLIPDAPGEAYSWTDLIPLNDELFILAFRDESLADSPDDADSEFRYIVNLVRPLVFPFLKDCVRIGELALRDNIVLAVLDNSRVMAELELRRAQIVPRNGSIVLDDADHNA